MPRPVTITMTRYAEDDELLRRVIAHAVTQEGVSGEVLFVDQSANGTIKESDFAGKALDFRLLRKRLPGLSAARNLALAEARHPLILFLDADALAAPGWAVALAKALEQDKVAIAGSRIEPGWPFDPPAYTRARVLRDQYSMLELGEDTMEVGRVVGAGFGIDTAKLPVGFVFDEALGRRDGRLFGGEESDFCYRACELGLKVVYAGTAQVTHLVPPERLRLGWILKRMIYAGYGRARQGGAPNPSAPPNWADWLFIPLYLPPYALGWLWGKFAR